MSTAEQLISRVICESLVVLKRPLATVEYSNVRQHTIPAGTKIELMGPKRGEPGHELVSYGNVTVVVRGDDLHRAVGECVIEDDDYFYTVSKEPYQRARERISNLRDRGVDVERHTLLRLDKTNDVSKIAGIYYAAREEGLKAVQKAAQAKYRAMTGRGLK